MSPVVITCPECGGCGEVSDPEGLGARTMQCPKCRGSGNVIPDPVENIKSAWGRLVALGPLDAVTFAQAAAFDELKAAIEGAS